MLNLLDSNLLILLSIFSASLCFLSIKLNYFLIIRIINNNPRLAREKGYYNDRYIKQLIKEGKIDIK
ncbi:hypothetical protein J2R98_000154 [Alkalibacillus filiformis]|uniref:Uncharacterized protein n=1 Tax=Alkalibacillus filiformis TaxID=200990 RepID=A0ABU0DPW1_9BACI|nr:hypothetical protein [Alkalibacillus filiformis]MDQ0350351.1 hypothetical protein [Alkalibacillus filiformis]